MFIKNLVFFLPGEIKQYPRELQAAFCMARGRTEATTPISVNCIITKISMIFVRNKLNMMGWMVVIVVKCKIDKLSALFAYC